MDYLTLLLVRLTIFLQLQTGTIPHNVLHQVSEKLFSQVNFVLKISNSRPI